jgi:hypothetical protein
MSDSTSSSGPKNSARRQFLRQGGVGLLAFIPFSIAANKLFTSGSSAYAEGKLVMVSAKDPQAVSLGYNANATKVDTKKWPKRAGAEGAKQFCYDCQFFQAKTANPKAEAAAPCQIFMGKGVNSKGWCNTWTQNPKVTA